jgi:hypothetical protein
MQGNLQFNNIEGIEFERIKLADNSAIYEIKFMDQNVSVVIVLNHEQFQVLYRLLLNYQTGMPGYSGMLDKNRYLYTKLD